MSRRILLGTGLAHTLCEILMQTFPVLIPLVTVELGIRTESALWMYSLCVMAFGWGAIPAGVLVQRYGGTAVVRGFLLLAVAACALLSVARGPWELGIGLFLLGCATSLYHPAGLTLVAAGVPRRGAGMGFHGMTGSFGAALGPILAGTAAGLLPGGWRASFALMAGLCLLGFLAGWRLLVDPPVPAHEAAEAPDADRRGVTSMAMLVLLTVCSGVTYRALVSYLPVHFAHDPVLTDVATDLPAFLTRTGRGTAAVCGLVTGLALLAGVPGQYLGGWFSDRCKLPLVIAVSFFGAAPLAWAVGVWGGWTGAGLAFGMVVFLLVQQPALNSLIASMAPARLRGAAYGLYFSINFGVGGLGPGLAGSLAGREGAAFFYTVAAATLIGAGGLALLLMRAHPLAPAAPRAPTRPAV